jgi:hypothetical protein
MLRQLTHTGQTLAHIFEHLKNQSLEIKSNPMIFKQIIMRASYLLIVYLLILSCGRPSSKSYDPIVYAEADDPELLQARNEAIKSLDYFIDSFSNIKMIQSSIFQ